jgi:simple sugar transport system ATP-binding protein
MTFGCAKNMNIMDNMFTNQYHKPEYSGKVLLKNKKIESKVNGLIKEYLVKCKSYKQSVGMLSGGNIQKVVVAREFSTDPKIIIANQPTRGIDVGAASFIRQRIIEFRDAGCAIILISADLNEVLELSDRLAVIYKGKFSGVFNDVKNVTEVELGKYMLGIKKDDRLEGIIYEQ